MVKIEVDNSFGKIVGNLHNEYAVNSNLHDAIRTELSYEVPSAEWSQKFKQGQWDGKISLYNKRTQSFPSGLTGRIRKLFCSQFQIPMNGKIVKLSYSGYSDY